MTAEEEQQTKLVQGIIDSTLQLMENIISRKSPKSCSRDNCKPHKQSKTGITRNTIFLRTLTNTQKLPARPRDFRIGLAEEEKNIGYSELSDILSSMVSQHLLENKRKKFPFPKGRPLSDIHESGIAEERRGAESYFRSSRMKEMIDQILQDSRFTQSIDNAILNSETFHKFLKYSFEVYLYQMKEDEKSFLNIMRPAINKYGLGHKSLHELDDSYIFAKDLPPDKIKRFAKGYASDTMRKFQRDGRNILYTVGTLFHLLGVYASEKREMSKVS